MNQEFQLIDRLSKKLPTVSNRVVLGVGDDAAVLKPPTGKLLLTVDALVEGIHFDFKFCEPSEVGRKALAVNESDIVAMGGKASAALVSLGVSNHVPESVLEQIYEGMADYAREQSIDVVGGNITLSPERLMLSVSLLGECLGEPITRSGACPGDIVFLSGPVGESAAGLALLKKKGRAVRSIFPNLTAHYLTPKARTDLVEILVRGNRVSSLIDISDGLSSELWHLAQASNVGFLINEANLPVSTELKKASVETGHSIRNWQLSGGEDYELLGTCPAQNWDSLQKDAKKSGGCLVQIGNVLPASQGVKLRETNGNEIPITPTGWNHLAALERD